MRGLSADKGINTIPEYFNSHLATNADGTQISGAGTLISEKVAQNTVNGNPKTGCTTPKTGPLAAAGAPAPRRDFAR